MAKGNTPIQVRLDAETRARWQAAADDAGYENLPEFIRAHVENGIASPTGPGAAAMPAITRLVSPIRDGGGLAAPSVPGQKRSYETDFKPEAKEKKKR